VVPDIRKLIDIYINSGVNTRAARVLCNMWWGFEKDKQPQTILGKLSKRFTREHLWNYDEEEMVALFKASGFEHIKRVSCSRGEVPDIYKLDSPSMENTSLYIEAKKT
jgi:hypothetical protein